MNKFIITISIFLSPWPSLAASKTFYIGSKKFTESVILGEALNLALQQKNLPSKHKAEIGGTRLLWNALLAGDIDAYPEYSGTLAEEIVRKKNLSLEELRQELKAFGIGMSSPLGFNNTYALGIKNKVADKLNLFKLSDLIDHPELKLGFSAEFLQRQDGWPGLKKLYRLPQDNLKGLDHDIAYRALDSGDIDVTDLYSTDAEIQYHELRVLTDNLAYFPRYEAVFLYRLSTAQEHPEFLQTIQQFSGAISESTMIELNKKAKIDKMSSPVVASYLLQKMSGLTVATYTPNRFERILSTTEEHLRLVFLSLFLAVLVAIPMGISASKYHNWGKFILGAVSGIQTIPAIALLVILIKPLNILGLNGIGTTPAFIALFLYSLLPIVRSTHAGLEQISPSLREIAAVLNLSAHTRLLKIELPLALPYILAGIKTSAVINVGFATIGALVGAGGYGQSILSGIRLDNYSLILEGAIPAIVMALSVQWLFDVIEGHVVSPGLKI